jgi:hypothetical protein
MMPDSCIIMWLPDFFIWKKIYITDILIYKNDNGGMKVWSDMVM